jgi:hypothetical protein
MPFKNTLERKHMLAFVMVTEAAMMLRAANIEV